MKYIALDIGNVCVKINPLRAAAALGIETVPEAMRRAMYAFETGVIGEEEFLYRSLAAFDGRFTPARLRAAFRAILIEPVPGMTELVKSLPGRGIQPVFFSDISVTHLAQTREIFAGAAAVPEGIYSFESGALKPGKAMFDRFEERYGKPLRYFDDRAELIAAAQQRGWAAVQFVSAQQMSDELDAAMR